MRRLILAAIGLAAAGVAGLAPRPATAQAPVTIQFWHGLPQPLGGQLEARVAAFNASQGRYKVEPSFRGGYPETMMAAIAAFRANSAPHLVQMFEVGTGTMMAAGRAVKPVHELLAEAGVEIDPSPTTCRRCAATTSPPTAGMMSMPFNSSTAVMFYNKDAFQERRAGPREAAQDLGGRGGGGAEAEGRRPRLPADQQLAGLAARWNSSARCTTCRWPARATASAAWTPSCG